jgi:hypothetical protein
MKSLPTASHSDVFLNCPYPWDKEIDVGDIPEAGDGATYGVIFHKMMASSPFAWKTIALEWPDSKALIDRVKLATTVLNKFLAGSNAWGLKLSGGKAYRELPMVLHLSTGDALKCRPPSEDTHEYPNHVTGQIRGTADLVVIDRASKTLLVLDYKTGYDVSWDVIGHDQIKTLLLMAVGVFLKGQTRGWRLIGAIFAARTGIEPSVHAEAVPIELLTKHLAELRAAQARTGHGFLRPGPWCRWCALRGVCPTKTGESLGEARAIIKAAGGVVKTAMREEGITVGNAGRIHQLSAAFEKLKKQVHPHIVDLVRSGEFIQQPDGKVLVLKPVSRRHLSMKSILRALGPERGGQLLQDLDARGCIETVDGEQLVAEDNE